MTDPARKTALHNTPASLARLTADFPEPDRRPGPMGTVARWIVVVVVVMHGLIHLLGAAKGLGWADVTQLTEPVSPVLGVIWLAAATLVVITAVLLASAVRWWWVLGAVAALVSQGVIFTSWNDAKAGTVANVILLVAVTVGYRSAGSLDE